MDLEVNSDDFVEAIFLSNMNICLDKRGIVFVTYLAGSIIDVKDKKEEKDAIMRITKGIKHPFLFSYESMVTVTKEANEFSIQVELEQPFLAIVILVDNFAYQLLADFYLRFYKPKVPYKVFKDETKAIEWLTDFKKNSEKVNSQSDNNSYQ